MDSAKIYSHLEAILAITELDTIPMPIKPGDFIENDENGCRPESHVGEETFEALINMYFEFTRIGEPGCRVYRINKVKQQ